MIELRYGDCDTFTRTLLHVTSSEHADTSEHERVRHVVASNRQQDKLFHFSCYTDFDGLHHTLFIASLRPDEAAVIIPVHHRGFCLFALTF